MSDEKKLSLKERLAKKNALKKSGGEAKQGLSMADFQKKQEENKRLEEERLKELERQKKEAERVRLEAEAKAAEEAARKKAEQDAEFLKQKRELELKEKDAAIKAISGETDAGKLKRSKGDYVILLLAVVFSLILAYSMGRTFLDRKAKNDNISMAEKAYPVFVKADKILDTYDSFFRNNKNQRIDFGAGKILGGEGEVFLTNDDFLKLPTYAASFYGYGTMVGKNTLKYVQLYSSLVRASVRLNNMLKNKKVRAVLEKVNELSTIITITKDTMVATFNSPYKHSKEVVIKMGTPVKILGVYEPTAEEKKAMKKKRRGMRVGNVQKVRVLLLDDPRKIGEMAVPNLYFTPVNEAHKYFQTLKPEYVKYLELYNTIKSDWKDISAIRVGIKKDLKNKAASAKLPMAF